MKALFKRKNFISHSGKRLFYKIECDALTMEDWETLASIIKSKYSFGRVIGIPTGGLNLANCLQQYVIPHHPDTLIVDDVMTTGKSFEPYLQQPNTFGIVVFDRSGLKIDRVIPMFRLHWTLI